MPCFQRRHNYHHHHPYHWGLHFDHPYRMIHNHHRQFPSIPIGTAAPFWNEKAHVTEPNVNNNNDDNVDANDNNSNDYYLIEMQVPGVSVENITLEEENGELEIIAIRMMNNEKNDDIKTYQDVLYLPPKQADFSQLTATLSNEGVLVIRVPKMKPKSPQIVVVEPDVGTPPPPPAATRRMAAKNQNDSITAKLDQDETKVQERVNDDNDKEEEEFRVALDLPGVKSEDMNITIGNQKLRVVAERKNALRGPCVMQREFCVTIPSWVDSSQAHAYLFQGVLTIVIPRNTAESNNSSSSSSNTTKATTSHKGGVRRFYATMTESGESVTPLVASLNLSTRQNVDDDDDDENTRMEDNGKGHSYGEKEGLEWETVEAGSNHDSNGICLEDEKMPAVEKVDNGM